MGINRTLMILTVLCIVLSFGSIAQPDANATAENAAGKNCTYSNISIHSIQGAGHKSPIAGCNVSGIQGIVTLNTSNGFFMQELHPDNDNRTSEGILVYTKIPPKDVRKTGVIYGPPKNVSVGDLVYVDGTVYEFLQNGNPLSLSVTEIVNPIYTIKHGNITLDPSLLGIGGLVPPDTVIEDDAFGDIAVNNSFDPGTDGIDFYESLEGMLVEINDAVVVSPTNPIKPANRTVVYVLSDNGSLAGLRTANGGIVVRPGDNNPERIGLDFYASSSEPINVGDSIEGPIVGAINYSNFNYRIVVDKSRSLVVTHANSDKSTVGDQITIAAYNVLDLSYNQKAEKFKTLAQQIVQDLGAPDIISLEEIIKVGKTGDGSDIYRTLNLLTENISIVSTGAVQYSNISIPDIDSDRNVAILYRTDRGLGFKGISTGNPAGNVTVISGLHLSPNPGWIYPKDPVFEKNMRKPLAAEFTFKGESLFVIANHFKAKDGNDGGLFGEFQPPRSVTNDKRHKQAQIVHNFVKEILKTNSMANVVVLGDFNDFQFSETLNILKGNMLTNPLENLPIEEQYTYNFEGNSQAIDHILISKNLVNMSSKFEAVHINSDFGKQTSDHDPVKLSIEFP